MTRALIMLLAGVATFPSMASAQAARHCRCEAGSASATQEFSAPLR